MFRNLEENREMYTFDDIYVRDFIRKSIKGGRVAALNRYLESNQCEELLNFIKKTFEKMVMKFRT